LAAGAITIATDRNITSEDGGAPFIDWNRRHRFVDAEPSEVQYGKQSAAEASSRSIRNLYRRDRNRLAKHGARKAGVRPDLL
jgi:hypothetical protein